MDWFHVLFAAMMVVMVLISALGGLLPGLRGWQRFRQLLEQDHAELYQRLARPSVSEGPGGPSSSYRRMVTSPMIESSGDEQLIRLARFLRLYPTVYGFMLLSEIVVLVLIARFVFGMEG